MNYELSLCVWACVCVCMCFPECVLRMIYVIVFQFKMDSGGGGWPVAVRDRPQIIPFRHCDSVLT